MTRSTLQPFSPIGFCVRKALGFWKIDLALDNGHGRPKRQQNHPKDVVVVVKIGKSKSC
jgi:hypothetical protein